MPRLRPPRLRPSRPSRPRRGAPPRRQTPRRQTVPPRSPAGALPRPPKLKAFRGTSLIRNRAPLGPYRRPMLRVLGGGTFSFGRVTPVAAGEQMREFSRQSRPESGLALSFQQLLSSHPGPSSGYPRPFHRHPRPLPKTPEQDIVGPLPDIQVDRPASGQLSRGSDRPLASGEGAS